MQCTLQDFNMIADDIYMSLGFFLHYRSSSLCKTENLISLASPTNISSAFFSPISLFFLLNKSMTKPQADTIDQSQVYFHENVVYGDQAHFSGDLFQ